MNDTLVERTMYVLLSGMYPTVSGGIWYVFWYVVFSVMAVLAVYGAYWIVTDTTRRYYTGKKCDYFGRGIGVVVCLVLCLVFCLMGQWSRMDYRKEKMSLIMERMKNDAETMERVDAVRKMVEKLVEDAKRFR